MNAVDSRKEIGRRLLALRIAMDFEHNQTAFARKLKITRPALANYESGDRRPNLEQLAKIRAQTGVTYEWLLHGEDANMPKKLFEKLDSILSTLAAP